MERLLVDDRGGGGVSFSILTAFASVHRAEEDVYFWRTLSGVFANTWSDVRRRPSGATGFVLSQKPRFKRRQSCCMRSIGRVGVEDKCPSPPNPAQSIFNAVLL